MDLRTIIDNLYSSIPVGAIETCLSKNFEKISAMTNADYSTETGRKIHTFIAISDYLNNELPNISEAKEKSWDLEKVSNGLLRKWMPEIKWLPENKKEIENSP